MALTRETMTDEQRKSVALEYLKAFDNGGVTSTGGSILDLFADDAQVYFPKWGLATGKDQIGKLFTEVGGTIKAITHHYAHFNWIFSGGDTFACEGTSHGEHRDGLRGPRLEDPALLHLSRPRLRRPRHRPLPLALRWVGSRSRMRCGRRSRWVRLSTVRRWPSRDTRGHRAARRCRHGRAGDSRRPRRGR